MIVLVLDLTLLKLRTFRNKHMRIQIAYHGTFPIHVGKPQKIIFTGLDTLPPPPYIYFFEFFLGKRYFFYRNPIPGLLSCPATKKYFFFFGFPWLRTCSVILYYARHFTKNTQKYKFWNNFMYIKGVFKKNRFTLL